MYNGAELEDKSGMNERMLPTPYDEFVEDKLYDRISRTLPHTPDECLETNAKFSGNYDSQNSGCISPASQSIYDQSSRCLTADDSDLVDDSLSAVRLSSLSLVSVTSASTSSFYPTLNPTHGVDFSKEHAKNEQTKKTISDIKDSWFNDKHKKYPAAQSRLNELYSTVEEKEKQLRVMRNGLNEKDLEIKKLNHKIRALEKNCERLQLVIESFRNVADQNELRMQEIISERDDLLVRNASLSRQIEFEKREWSIERERLSMELDDVTRELELQKMLLNGQSISEIVQRWQEKVFDLEGMIADRDRAIRAQQQRISILEDADRISYVNSFGSQTKLNPPSFAYIKRLFLQYLTSSDEECMQLLRNVSSALHFSNEEEREVWENLRNKLRIS